MWCEKKPGEMYCAGWDRGKCCSFEVHQQLNDIGRELYEVCHGRAAVGLGTLAREHEAHDRLGTTHHRVTHHRSIVARCRRQHLTRFAQENLMMTK